MACFLSMGLYDVMVNCWHELFRNFQEKVIKDGVKNAQIEDYLLHNYFWVSWICFSNIKFIRGTQESPFLWMLKCQQPPPPPPTPPTPPPPDPPPAPHLPPYPPTPHPHTRLIVMGMVKISFSGSINTQARFIAQGIAQETIAVIAVGNVAVNDCTGCISQAVSHAGFLLYVRVNLA